MYMYIHSYTTRDGRYMSVGALEPKFYQYIIAICVLKCLEVIYRLLLEGMGLNEDDLPSQMDTEKWVSNYHTVHILIGKLVMYVLI